MARHPLQRAWLKLNVAQCGYCQVGMIMAAAAMLKVTPQPTDADIDAHMTNLCRCGTYARVRAAIHEAAKEPSHERAREPGTARLLNRRTFLISTAVVGGGLTLAILLPRAGNKAAPGEPAEVGAVADHRRARQRAPARAVPRVRQRRHDHGGAAHGRGAACRLEQGSRGTHRAQSRCPRGRRVQGHRWQVLDVFGPLHVPRPHAYDAAGRRQRARATGTAAALRWSVPVAEVEARDSVLTHAASNRTLRFGEVAAAAAGIKLPQEPEVDLYKEIDLLRERDAGKLVDPQIVTGTAPYGIDVKVPGMVYGALMQSPVHGGRLKSHDFEAIRNMPGVIGVAVVNPDEPRKRLEPPANDGESFETATVAVVAEHYWQARQALDALPVEWDDGDGAKWKTTEQVNAAVVARLDAPGDKVEKDVGDALGVLGKSGRIVEATYITPFADQAPLEPLNAIARVHARQTRGLAWRRDPGAVLHRRRRRIRRAVRERPSSPGHDRRSLRAAKFRRRSASRRRGGQTIPGQGDQGHLVARGDVSPGTLSLAHGRAVCGRRSGRTACPRPIHSRICCPGYGTAGITNGAYVNGVIPNVRLEESKLPLHVRWGSYRAPGYNSYAFMMETFIDECAARARHRTARVPPQTTQGLSRSRLAQGASTKWRRSPAGARRCPKARAAASRSPTGATGRARTQVGGTTAAVVAHVEVSRDGVLKVLQLDIAFDCGRVFNRDAVEAQMQGGMLFGLNMALNEELNIENGRIVEGNFDTYPMLRMADMPRLRVHFGGLTGAERYSEVGEPPVGPVGPAVANAIFAATGKRIRTMPFRKHDLRWA